MLGAAMVRREGKAMAWHDPIGYVVDASIFCPACARRTDSPIFEGSETDRPSHCEECEELIPESLTGDGVRYVLDALDDVRNGRGGRLEIVAAWAELLRWYGLDRRERVRLERFTRWMDRAHA
jgi:hypothetical protein